MNYNPNDFKRGTKVSVKVDSDDILTSDFIGHIVGIRHIGQGFFVHVTSDGNYDNYWDFRPDQLTFMTKNKTPTVYEKHIIVIDGVEHLVKGMDWTESIGEAIDGNWLENSPEEILEYIKEQD